MNTEPRKLLLRKRDIIAWIGISEYRYKQLLRDKVITPRLFKPNGCYYFMKEEIRNALITWNTTTETNKNSPPPSASL